MVERRVVEPGTVTIYCQAEAGPDRPFCDACEDRHPEDRRRGVTVGAIPLDRPHPLEDKSSRLTLAEVEPR